MPNSTDMLAAAKAAIDAAGALVKASQALIDNAHAQMTATPPTLTLDQYRVLVDHHAAVVGNAATIRQTAAIGLGQNIKQEVAALQATTDKLNQQMARLAEVQNVVDRAAQVLVAVGALATLVASPSLMTADAVVTAMAALAS